MGAPMAKRVIGQAMIAEPAKRVMFTYTDRHGAVTTRDVEPYEINDGQLFGFCLEKDTFRRFELERMSDVSIGSQFKPRRPIKVML